MQSNLRSLFAGKLEAAELPPKRGPGRPPKVRKREEEVEQPDELVEALRSVPDQPDAYDETSCEPSQEEGQVFGK